MSKQSEIIAVKISQSYKGEAAFLHVKPMIIAPAMNTQMWRHPVTDRHCMNLKSFGARFVPPQSKKLYCGDEGLGALADINYIVSKTLNPHYQP